MLNEPITCKSNSSSGVRIRASHAREQGSSPWNCILILSSIIRTLEEILRFHFFFSGIEKLPI